MSDAPHLPDPATPAHPDTDVAVPTAWAGGRQVVVPGLGVGQMVRDGPPRVVQIALGAPTAAVFTVPDEAGTARATVVVDPAVSPEQLDQLIRAGELVDAEAGAVARTPRIPWPRSRPRGTALAVGALLAGAAATVGALVAGGADRTIDADAPPAVAVDGPALTVPAV